MLAESIESPSLSGMVWKQGRWFGIWKRRYFVLKENTLYYFDANKKGEPVKGTRGSFNLSQWKFERIPSSPSSSSTAHIMMKMMNTSKKGDFFLLRAESEEDAGKWLLGTGEAYYEARFGAHIKQIVVCQSLFRGRSSRLKWRKTRRSVILIQATYRMHMHRAQYIILRLRLIKIQAYARRWFARRDYKAIVRRKRIAAEMLSTERLYVNNLLSVVELFQNPLITSSGSSDPILSKEDVGVIFGNINQLYEVNNALLQTLIERIDNWKVGSKVGDVFCEHANKLMMVYVPYILQYSEALECVERNKKRSLQFKEFLQKATEDPRTKSLDIASFLIQPVQRLPRYELLLKDLLRCTEAGHIDYADINEGLQRIVKVTTHINEKRREKESVVQMQELKNNLVGQLSFQIQWEIYHRLIREGEATCAVDAKVSYIILTNDFLLLTQKQKDKYRVRIIVYLRDATVSSVNEETGDGAQTTEKLTISASGSDNVVLHTPDVNKPWSVDISRVIDQIQSRNTSSPKSASPSVIMRPKGTLAKMVSFGLSSLSSSSQLQYNAAT